MTQSHSEYLREQGFTEAADALEKRNQPADALEALTKTPETPEPAPTTPEPTSAELTDLRDKDPQGYRDAMGAMLGAHLRKSRQL